MSKLRHKAPPKCECGNPVAEGSVFCPACKAAVTKRNDRAIKQEDQVYQQQVKDRGRRGK